MKKTFETLHCMASRYVALDQYKEALAAELPLKPLKKKKRFSFLNPDNLLIIKTHSENIIPINGGGLRSLLQEFDQGMNLIWN